MTLIQIEKRVKALETTVQQLAQQAPLSGRGWYRTNSGRFANDPVFNEIVKLGRAYRKTQAPPRRPKL
ncbi:MAG TPA: hypothetical protein VNT99_21335 [Methylomirabilota bacterium]|nr:hypothetical protein [Methylomirabilota bacterium]